MSDLSQELWKSKLQHSDEAVVLDVRTDHEVANGVIPNALHIDMYRPMEFLDRIKSLDREKEYFIYCKSGVRSRQTCNIMRQLGFNRTYNLVGGIDQWMGEIVIPK